MSAIIEVRGVTRRFGGLAAVDDVSFDVHEGAVKALIGPNGAGKSTLFNSMTGFDNPDAGTVHYAGMDVTGRKPHRIVELGMSRTFQNTQLFDHMSVLDNVKVGRYTRTRTGFLAAALRLPRARREERLVEEEAGRLLRLLGIEDFADVPAGDIPHGRRRLLEICRALASEPSVLLLDEPAAGLNNAETSKLADALLRIRDMGITLIVVEHDMGLVMEISDSITNLDSHRRVKRGIAMVPEGRMLFASMTVDENLRLGAYSRRDSTGVLEDLELVFQLFPVLEERLKQMAGTLSGGEQQMLAIGRALMSRPRLLLLDEPSLGLAPMIIREIFSVLDRLRERDVTLFLVEQDAKMALRHADRGYVMRTGTIALSGTADELIVNDDVRLIYLGGWQGDETRSTA